MSIRIHLTLCVMACCLGAPSRVDATCSATQYVPREQRSVLVAPPLRTYLGPSPSEYREYLRREQAKYDSYVAYRSAWEEEAGRLLKQQAHDQALLNVADSKADRGNVAVAAKIYCALAQTKKPTDVTAIATGRLGAMHQEFRRQLLIIEKDLELAVDVYDRSRDLKLNGAENLLHQVRQVYERFEYLRMRFEDVPEVDKEVREAISKARSQSACMAAIHEPEAAALWGTARAQEAKGERCCAWHTLRQLQQLAPAPTAALADGVLKRMREDAKLMEDVALCSELRWCQKAMRRAENLFKVRPDKARDVFTEVVRRSPRGTEIHQAALSKLQDSEK